MSDELRAAAERLRRYYAGPLEGPAFLEIYDRIERPRGVHNMDLFRQDQEAVITAWLAEHPADSDEPVTEEWLRSVGFRKGGSPLARPLYLGCVTFEDVGEGVVSICDLTETTWLSRRFKNRGDVRRLLRALGIEERTP